MTRKKGQEPVVIKVVVQRGKEVLFSSNVPEDVGLVWEFPKPIPLDCGATLEAITVSPKVGRDEVAEEERAARRSRLKVEERIAEPPPKEEEEPTYDRLRTEVEEAVQRVRATGVPEVVAEQHVHEIAATSQKAFLSCVNVEDCVEAAHDGFLFLDRCRCGATRGRNVNKQHVETGIWKKHDRIVLDAVEKKIVKGGVK